MAKKSDWLIGILIFGSVLFVVLIFVIGFWGTSSQDGSLGISGSKIGIVEIEGVIFDSQSIVRQLQRLSESDAIRAIVLRINSPGGGVAAAQEIFEAVKAVHQTKKPVVASMGSVAASGGYYIACGADSILAISGTTTGSIGVIMEVPNFTGLLDKIGVQFNVIKSGKLKDTGAFYRQMTQEEREYLQQYIDDAFNQFVEVVAENRKLTRAEVLALADGRVFTGRQALALRLIDRLGNYQDAIQLAADLAGVKGKPKTYRVPQKKVTLFDLLFSDISKIREQIEATPALKYQFKLGSF